MTQSTLSIASISPEDLAYKLLELSDKERKEFNFLSLSISGPEVLVQSFKIPGLKIQQVKDRLKAVSVEVLNLPADQIAFDYQILSSDEKGVCGLFACCPKSLIDEYVKIIVAEKFTPLSISPYILTSINAFYQNGEQNQRFCLLDFSREGYINLAVIHEQKFELLRKVPYANYDEALFEIIQSLRSACAKSSVKHFDRICFSGDIPEQDRIIKEIENSFDAKTQFKDAHCIKEALKSQKNIFSINLIHDISISHNMRKSLLMGFNILIALTIVCCFFTGAKINKAQKLIENLTEQTKSSSYSFALKVGVNTR